MRCTICGIDYNTGGKCLCHVISDTEQDLGPKDPAMNNYYLIRELIEMVRVLKSDVAEIKRIVRFLPGGPGGYKLP